MCLTYFAMILIGMVICLMGIYTDFRWKKITLTKIGRVLSFMGSVMGSAWIISQDPFSIQDFIVFWVVNAGLAFTTAYLGELLSQKNRIDSKHV